MMLFRNRNANEGISMCSFGRETHLLYSNYFLNHAKTFIRMFNIAILYKIPRIFKKLIQFSNFNFLKRFHNKILYPKFNFSYNES